MPDFSTWDGYNWQTMNGVDVWDGTNWRTAATTHVWDGTTWQLVFQASATTPTGVTAADASICSGATPVYQSLGQWNPIPNGYDALIVWKANGVSKYTDYRTGISHTFSFGENVSGQTIELSVTFINVSSGAQATTTNSFLMPTKVCTGPRPPDPIGGALTSQAYCSGQTTIQVARLSFNTVGSAGDPYYTGASYAGQVEWYVNGIYYYDNFSVGLTYLERTFTGAIGSNIYGKVQTVNNSEYSGWIVASNNASILFSDICSVPFPGGLSITIGQTCGANPSYRPIVFFDAPGSNFQTAVTFYRRNPGDPNGNNGDTYLGESSWLDGSISSYQYGDFLLNSENYYVLGAVRFKRITSGVVGDTNYTAATLLVPCPSPPSNPTVRNYQDSSVCSSGTTNNQFSFDWSNNTAGASFNYYAYRNGAAQGPYNLGQGSSTRGHYYGDNLYGSTSYIEYWSSLNGQNSGTTISSTITFVDMCAPPPDVTGLAIQDTSFPTTSRATGTWTNNTTNQVLIEWYLDGSLRSSTLLGAGATSNSLYEDLSWTSQQCYFKVKFYNGTYYGSNWAQSAYMYFS